MQKIIINTSFGGYGLSAAALEAYYKRRGIDAEAVENSRFVIVFHAPIPKKHRKHLEDTTWKNGDSEEFKKWYDGAVLDDSLLARDDPDLVWVVEQQGKAASGRHAALEVVSIPDDVKWKIHEYEGREHVAEVHQTWWGEGV